MEIKRSLTRSMRKLSLRLRDQPAGGSGLGTGLDGSESTEYGGVGRASAPVTPSEVSGDGFFSISFEQHSPQSATTTATVGPRGKRSHSSGSIASSVAAVSHLAPAASSSSVKSQVLPPSAPKPIPVHSESLPSLRLSTGSVPTVPSPGAATAPISPASITNEGDPHILDEEQEIRAEESAADEIAQSILAKVQADPSQTSQGWSI